MQSRERLLAAMRGQPVDRTPWGPFLTYWWDQNLVADAERLGEIGFKRAVKADILMRGHLDRPSHNQYFDLYMYKTTYGKTRISEKIYGEKKQIVYDTPHGSVTAGYVYSSSGDTWFLIDHPIKTVKDFKILEFIAYDMILSPDFEPYIQEQKKYPDALFMPLVSPFTKTGFQSMIEFWVGTEELIYFVADEPDAVKNALNAIKHTSVKGAKICADSPAEVFITWEDSSTTNISPALYEQYILPEINEWCDILHEKGKLYIQHTCGHLRHLMPIIKNSKIDGIESVSEAPTGDITIEEISEILPEHMVVIGGIEPTFFIKSNKEELEKRVDQLCKLSSKRRFILANADSCPPEVDINKFGIVSARIHKNFGLEDIDIKIFDKNDRIDPRGVSAYHGSPSKQI